MQKRCSQKIRIIGIMILITVFNLSLFSSARAQVKKFEQLSTTNAAVLLIDHQSGLASSVADYDKTIFYNGLMALANIAKVYKLPTIIAAINPEGVLGGTLPELLKILPDATIIHRHHEINAWTNPDFHAAVKKTGRKKLIIAGITTDVCAALPALSAVAEGYDAYVVMDASGTMSQMVQNITLYRLTQGGVVPTNWYAVLGELLPDPSNPPPGFEEIINKWTPGIFLGDSYKAAMEQLRKAK